MSRYTKAELIARTPWKQFVSHPVALALLASAFGYVSTDVVGDLAMFVVLVLIICMLVPLRLCWYSSLSTLNSFHSFFTHPT